MAGPLILTVTAGLLIMPAWAEAGQSSILPDRDSREWHCRPRHNISCGQSCTCYSCDGHAVVANCSHTGVSSVPADIPQNTTVLLLEKNGISAIPPGNFSSFHQIEWLDLTGNLLSNLSGIFNGLRKLTHLGLSSNRLRYHPDVFTEDVFHCTPSLRSLHLINNSFREDKKDLEYPGRALANLPLVNLTLDGLPNATFGEGFDTLKQLKSIRLNGFGGYCDVGTLRNDTFLNTSRLESLEIVHCRIKWIEPEAFSPLKNLRYLDLSYNEDLGFNRLAHGTYGLVNSSLRELHINNIHKRFATCTSVQPCHLFYLQHTQLETISLSENRIAKISPGVLQLIPKSVKKIDARNNIFTVDSYINELHYLENLRELDLSFTHFYEYSYNYVGSENDDEDDMDQRCGYDLDGPVDTASLETTEEGRFNVESRYTEQVSFSVHDDNEMASSPSEYRVNFSLPNKLSTLSFSWNKMYYDIPVIYVSACGLQELDFSHNFFPRWFGPIDGVQNLTKLNMAHTSAIEIGNKFFMNFTSLDFLNLSYNHLENLLASEESFKVFGWLQNLRVLDLRGNGLCRVHESAFKELRSLEELYLQDNKLIVETFQIDLFHLERLRILNLRSNTFSKLDVAMYRGLDVQARNGSIEVNLANNPLTCSCKNLDFLVWMHVKMLHKGNKGVFLSDKTQYTCLNQNGSRRTFDEKGVELNNIKLSCVNTILLTTVLVVAVLLTSTLTVGVILYRYRWRIRYAYYSRKKATASTVPQEDFVYDALVSYAEDDAGFVETLRETLESRGIRLCIPHRDCSANQLEIAALVHAIHSSRRTVCILSQQYLKDYWHQYEMHMALQEGIQTGRDDAVLMLLYDKNLRAHSLPKEVLFCIRANSYLDHPQDTRCLLYFWDNLERALRPNEERLLSV